MGLVPVPVSGDTPFTELVLGRDNHGRIEHDHTNQHEKSNREEYLPLQPQADPSSFSRRSRTKLPRASRIARSPATLTWTMGLPEAVTWPDTLWLT